MFNETPAFRRHALLPKRSRGRSRDRSEYLPPLPEDELSHLAGKLGPAERCALREICQASDLIMVDGEPYLLARVSPPTLDALAAFEAEAEDAENDLEDEPQDMEDDSDGDNAVEYVKIDRIGNRGIYDDEEPDGEPPRGARKSREAFVIAKRGTERSEITPFGQKIVYTGYGGGRDADELRRVQQFVGAPSGPRWAVDSNTDEIVPATIDGVVILGRFTPLGRRR